MEQEYTTILELDEFRAAKEQLSDLLNGLQSAEMATKEHGDVEAHLSKQGTEFLRLLLQGNLNTRSKDEPHLVSLLGSDEVCRNHVRENCKRRLMSLFGEVTVTRRRYGKRGSTSLFPLDRQLNLPPKQASHGLRERIGKEVAIASFDHAVLTISETTGGKVAKHQVEDAAVEIAQDFERFYDGQHCKTEAATNDILVLSIDGKGIVMRPEGLREATRQAGEQEQHKMKTRLSRGEKRNRKRMATVTAVYDIERHERTPESIMKLEEVAVKKPRAQNKRVWASVERNAETVTKELFDEASKRDMEQKKPWVILVDGQKQQLKNVCDEVKRRKLKNTTIILDFIHVLEYLWAAVFCFYQEGTAEAEKWVCERALRVLQGKASSVAAGMRRSAKFRQLSEKDRKPVDDCAAYLLNHVYLLRYDKFLTQGYPIATGVIEGACRHLIKDRLDITGARWGLKGAEAILKLRSLLSSGDFDEYWKFHKAAELERNYTSYYAGLSRKTAA